MKKFPIWMVLSAILVCVGLYAETATQSIVLATTTSTQQTGLLDVLLPAFARETGILVKPIAVGTGKALELGKNGDADVVMVHARSLEDRFVADGYGENAWDLMYNDFVILGPASDPAGVKGVASASIAFRKLADEKTVFVSRADKSGTHQKELELWESAKVKKTGASYLEAGQGMAETMRLADEKGGYTLCDRATWLAVGKSTGLALIYQNPAELNNPYGVIVVSEKKVPGVKTGLANRFVEWLVSPAGQKIIVEYKLEGETLFHLSVKKR